MSFNRFFAGPIRAAIILVAIVFPSVADAQGVDYDRDIKPVLKARCYACHGALKQEGELRLDTGMAIVQGGSTGSAVDLRVPDESALLRRVSSGDITERMPPEGEPLTESQIEALRSWIGGGAKFPDSEQAEADPSEHWAFQTPRRPGLPKGSLQADTENPIDAFLNAELASRGLSPRPQAEKQVLLRRIYLDLIGLPPTVDELQSFLDDESPNAYNQVVDRLLEDDRYGQRWARHWMDIWRYSDWYGRRDANDVRNSASQIFRWRDWIVQSLNEGRGYDHMLQAMLAADEIFPGDYQTGVATGFIIRNYYSLNPNDWMRNTVEHTTKAFLGLTFNCAHCHDHKYDPIEQDDYFRMRAFFEPVFIRQDRVAGEADPGEFQDYTYGGSRSVQRLGAVRVYDRKPDAPTWFYTGGDERNQDQERGSILPGVPKILQPEALKIEPVTLPTLAWYPGLRPEILQMMLAAAGDEVTRSKEALQTLASALSIDQATDDVCPTDEKLPSLALVSAKAAEARLAAALAKLESLEARIAAETARFIDQSPEEVTAERVRAASFAQRQAKRAQAQSDLLDQEVKLLEAESIVDEAQRGKAIEAANQSIVAAKAAVEAAERALADDQLAETFDPLSQQFPRESTGRRRALALWLTSPTHPLTARVAVNHIWTRHFRSPLVATVYDFGRNGTAATHPELLDWLAVEFMQSGWDMKHLHRLIVTSEAYRRTSSTGGDEAALAIDPENKLLWRMNHWRMESEVVRDSLLYIAGRLDVTAGGIELENKDSLTTNRRSLYYSSHPESGGKSVIGELFDAPDPLDCYRRSTSILPQQALALTNSELVHQSSVAVVQAWEAANPATQNGDGGESLDAAERFVVNCFLQILCRAPSDDELRICREILGQQQQLAPDPQSARAITQARESFARILMNHNDFVTVR